MLFVFKKFSVARSTSAQAFLFETTLGISNLSLKNLATNASFTDTYRLLHNAWKNFTTFLRSRRGCFCFLPVPVQEHCLELSAEDQILCFKESGVRFLRGNAIVRPSQHTFEICSICQLIIKFHQLFYGVYHVELEILVICCPRASAHAVFDVIQSHLEQCDIFVLPS